MLGRAVRSTFHVVERFLNLRGYRVTWHPLAADQDEAHGLKVDIHLLFARLMLRNKDILFVEIGANDGVTNDPIYPFAKRYGWQGVLVEPQAEIFSKLERNYAGVRSVRFVNAAIGAADGEQTFFKIRQSNDPEIRGAGFPTQLASLRKESVLSQTKFVPNVADMVEEVRVPVLTFDTLMQKVGADGVDVLVIDAEGYDILILSSIDIERIKPAIVQYEHYFISKADQMELAGRFRDAGYRIAKDNLNTIACLRASLA